MSHIPISEGVLFNPYAPKKPTTSPPVTNDKTPETLVKNTPGTNQKQIGIQLSQSCKTMLKNNVTTICPTYPMLQLVFPDNTDPNISGALKDKNGFVEREFPKLRNSYLYYPQVTNQTILWLDPPLDVQNHLDALIVIEPSLNVYKLLESNKMPDYEIAFGQFRYVDPHCQLARIKAHDWIFLVGDSMRYLLNNCDQYYTNFNHIFTKVYEKTPQDFSSSYNYKLYSWVNEIKEKCLKTYGCDITPPER